MFWSTGSHDVFYVDVYTLKIGERSSTDIPMCTAYSCYAALFRHLSVWSTELAWNRFFLSNCEFITAFKLNVIDVYTYTSHDPKQLRDPPKAVIYSTPQSVTFSIVILPFLVLYKKTKVLSKNNNQPPARLWSCSGEIVFDRSWLIR